MDVRTCKECKRLFQYSGYGDIFCPACKQKDEEEFEKVKAFLFEHPRATGQEVYKETGVITKKITKWLKEERLIVPGSDGILTCEQCGQPISRGKLCDDCKKSLAISFAQAITSGNASAAEADQAQRLMGMKFMHK